MSKAEQLGFSEADINEIKTVERGLRAKSGVIDDLAITMSREEMNELLNHCAKMVGIDYDKKVITNE